MFANVKNFNHTCRQYLLLPVAVVYCELGCSIYLYMVPLVYVLAQVK